MVDAVKAFKLTTGEEVVAALVDTKFAEIVARDNGLTSYTAGKPTSYTLRRPNVLRFQPVAPGQVGLAFVPWTLSNPEIETVEIPAEFVISIFDPSEQVTTQYLSQTSGIELIQR